MRTTPFIMHALSPLHAGTGQAADIVDLPIARLKSTGIPFVPGSSIKGVLREARRDSLGDDDPVLLAVFGPDTNDAGDHAGAVVLGDARLLALPVRSFKGTFAWVSSPLLLTLARRDTQDETLPVPSGLGRKAWLGEEAQGTLAYRDTLYLEDLDLPVEAQDLTKWHELLAPVFGSDGDLFRRRFAVVDDETMTFLWETATQLDARVRIATETGVVAKGALWLEESLPPETLLIGVIGAERSRKKDVEMTPQEVAGLALPGEEILQFGGKATVGRGRCRILPLEGLPA